MISAFLAMASAAQTPVNPMLLPIGGGRVRQVQAGWTDLRSGRSASAEAVADAAKEHRFVLLGESHDNPHHHRMQADVIRALAAQGREVVIGLEMFTRDNQRNLAGWTHGSWTEAEFIERSNWKTQWGFDYSLYRPVFEAARELRAPLVALNLPRGWVRRIGRQGPAALEPGEAIWAPDIDTDTPDHLKVFTALLGGHPLAGERGRNMHAAQVSWDEAMAQTAVDWMAGVRSRKAVMVILAGSGHALYGQGINLRLSRKGHPSLTVIGSEVGSVRDGVMSSVGEFLYVSPDVPRS